MLSFFTHYYNASRAHLLYLWYNLFSLPAKKEPPLRGRLSIELVIRRRCLLTAAGIAVHELINATSSVDELALTCIEGM